MTDKRNQFLAACADHYADALAELAGDPYNAALGQELDEPDRRAVFRTAAELAYDDGDALDLGALFRALATRVRESLETADIDDLLDRAEAVLSDDDDETEDETDQ